MCVGQWVCVYYFVLNYQKNSMEDDTLDFGLSTSSKHTTLQPPSDDYIEVEDIEDDDDLQSELACPFCSEDFDLVGLCCHIDDEHFMETKSGICPVCLTKMGINMAAHIITQHENILKALCKKKLFDGESRSALALLRKKLQDQHLQTLPEGSSHVFSISNMAPDPLLLSFIYNPPPVDKPKIIQPSSSTEASLPERISDENMLQRNFQPSPLLDKDQEEKARICEFVHGLLFSTILGDI